MNIRTPMVSVVMPVFNAEKYLAKAIESILTQTLTDFEFIIINDGSTDGSAAIIESYSDKDPRINVILNDKNKGIVHSLNTGIAEAKCDYLAIMHADDISRPERLEKQIDFFIANPNVGILGSWIQVIDHVGMPKQVLQLPSHHNTITWEMCFRCSFAHPSMMINKLLLENNKYREDYLYVEDYDLWVRLVQMTRAANLPEVLLNYRHHPESLTSTKINNIKLLSQKVQQRMVKQILGREVPIEIINGLNSKKFLNSDIYKQTLHLIFELFQLFNSKNNFPKNNIEYIKYHTIKKMLVIFYHRFPKMDSAFAISLINKISGLFGLKYILRIGLHKIFTSRMN
jgi:glycosyltransferase involved in cell wall biosynthesis